MPSIAKIKNSVLEIGAGALLIVNKDILGLHWASDYGIYLFDSHSKDEKDNLSSSITDVQTFWNLIQYTSWKIPYDQFITMLEQMTWYFQVQFIKVQWTPSTNNTIKCTLKKRAIVSKAGETSIVKQKIS